MSKISMFAGVAIAAIGIASLSSGSASAACLNSQLPTISLSQSAMNANVGTEYDKGTYDAQFAKNGNRCPTTEQSYPGTNDGSATSNNTNMGLANSNNSSSSNGARGNGNGDQMKSGL
jgi:hypothetical protein